ncbi:MAG: type II toxin-antitoxin system RelE/ParE family toxin [Acetobacteraceae bacterium]|nr:type II toxin-antitoxin system RelE/ParE family toxin [Acetobacteraceae bacterium]
MPALIWTARALADLARLHRFLKSKNPDAARRAVRAVRQGLRLLETHPDAGRPAEGVNDPAFREWWMPFGDSGYLALYRRDGSRVVVLAVRHGKELGF